ncbi:MULTISPECIES: type VI secretion system Vgr family protein [unclassified Pseudomonas]|jgi:type VI secretion system secreted protein VgrG|uniref:type VI secretion system Vgr family protein n=1 Tax=unclassified Pseudomonas TaxID=196821 RepID=UPI002A36935B|nr:MULTISPECIES: type VI secretion system tip protein TssI/VgrG [unclassified Pseudomonas]MDX9673961.1 type VI secretion system tip protein TssI/VgrG [Pseudomonas sp. P8_250]WPN37516.1 type VI secretion system tip protein TssI/VgrG [Pseudomonas sp. P8_139]WPN40682.1 type VI secretion system tip protein TssI/VgrG [Pseudomonas sp. P8_229]
MLNDQQSPFTLTLTDGPLCLPVLRFSGKEALNQPFRFEIEVMGLAPALPPGSLLRQPAYLRLGADHGIHGQIHSVSCEHRASHRIAYRLTLVPQLLSLAQAPRRRVFVQSSVPAILAQLLGEHGLTADSYRIEMSVGHYPVRPFCIQYEESDLALLQRLCEEEGIHYHFEHYPLGHVVVFADDNLSLPQEPMPLPFAVADDSPSPRLNTVFQRHDATPIMAAPGIRNRGQQVIAEDAANHSVPTVIPLQLSGTQRHAEQRSRRHLQRQRCQSRSIHGRSDCSALRSGHLLQISEHPINAFNEQWLMTELQHQGQHPSILDPTSEEHHYRNHFTALPWSTEFRPPLAQPRPNIAGYHLARVLGTSGQPAQLDELGRIGVSLWPAQEADAACLWLPIALTGANGRLTAHELPRAGSEVWVSFLDSDPDRPILCLANPRPAPPRETPPTRDSSLLLDWLLNSAGP